MSTLRPDEEAPGAEPWAGRGVGERDEEEVDVDGADNDEDDAEEEEEDWHERGRGRRDGDGVWSYAMIKAVFWRRNLGDSPRLSPWIP